MLNRVIVMLKSTSPLNKSVQKLDTVPPGEHPNVNKPNLQLGLFAKKSFPKKYEPYKKTSLILYTIYKITTI